MNWFKDEIDDFEFIRPNYKICGKTVMLYNTQKIPKYYFSSTRIKKILFVDNCELRCIEEGSFINNNIKKLELPSGLRKIGKKAFKNNKLEYVEIPDTVTYIGEKAFDNITIKYKNNIFDKKFIKKFGCENIVLASQILEIIPTYDFKEDTKENIYETYLKIKESFKYIKLEEYSKMKVPKLNIESLDEIFDYGSVLTEQTDLITTQCSELVQNKIDMVDEARKLQESIKKISIENQENNKKGFSLIRKKTEIIEISLDEKKQVLDQLRNYLIEHANSLQEGIEEFKYIQKSIGIFLVKANKYLERLNIAKAELQKELSNKQYLANDLSIYDDQLRRQMLDDKIAGITTSIIQMIQQYQKMTIQMRTHASLLNHVNIAKGTTLQNLYVELALTEEGKKEKNSVETLIYLKDLLNELTINNENVMVDNILKISDLSKKSKNITINNEDKQLIEKILEEQNLLTKEKTKINKKSHK